MSNLSITQLLSQLQNMPMLQQQAADAAQTDAASDPNAMQSADGQNLPDSTAGTAAAASTEGTSAPVLSPDMTAVLLQFQESQEMSDAQALLYGDGNVSDATLFGDVGASDPLQAFLDQSSTTGASLMSSNQTLLDYLTATDTPQNGPATDPGLTSAS